VDNGSFLSKERGLGGGSPHLLPSNAASALCNVLIIINGEKLLSRAHSPSRPTIPCQISTTACSQHSQLASACTGCYLYPQPEDAPCLVTEIKLTFNAFMKRELGKIPEHKTG